MHGPRTANRLDAGDRKGRIFKAEPRGVCKEACISREWDVFVIKGRSVNETAARFGKRGQDPGAS